MKKKLFTLLVALVAVAGFQAKSAPFIGGIQTGDTTTAPGTSYTNKFFDNERGGYAGIVSKTPNKLTVSSDGKTLAWQPGSPDPKKDQITVTPMGVNFLSFKQGNVTLQLTYNGTPYENFVVFRGGYDDARVLDYNTPDKGRPAYDPEQVITPQGFEGTGATFTGSFEGFLGINANGYVDDSNLLIVVHDQDGTLSLIAYKDYVASIGTNLYPKDSKKQYYPLYVKTMEFTGRWATPADFANSKFVAFTSITSTDSIKAYDAVSLINKTAKDPNIPNPVAGLKGYTTFTIKQVDYVKNQDVTVTNNIFRYNNGADFQGLDFDGTNKNGVGTNSKYFGTYNFDPEKTTNAIGDATINDGTTAYVIPLFVLAAPDDGCKILSVSRYNQNGLQTQGVGGMANMLELRNYGQYFDATKGTWGDAQTSTLPAGFTRDQFYATYTSLQKFAIWIDADGNMSLYPAASYFWDYGQKKDTQKDQILPNAVLKYNNINVFQVINDPYSGLEDKTWGIKIGYWDSQREGQGHTSTLYPNPDAYTATAPNIIHTGDTEYSDWQYAKAEPKNDVVFPNPSKYFFLDVINPNTPDPKASNAINSAFGTKGYQYNRHYVLSTQVDENGNKILVLVPKEEVMADTTTVMSDGSKNLEYWRVPNDSVNMAAHWEIQKDGDFYRFINMLGDTLQYNADILQNLPLLQPVTNLAGGYLPINRLMPGSEGWNDKNTVNAHPQTYADYLFGRPQKNSTADYSTWFHKNPVLSDADVDNLNTCDLWKVTSLDGKNFFLQLTGVKQPNVEVDLSINTEDILHPNSVGGWYQSQMNTIGAPDKNVYFQQDMMLGVTQLGDLQSIQGGDFTVCPGLLLSFSPIYYVPTFADVYTNEPNNGIINTNDANFMNQDSLTAYTFLDGTFNIKEAIEVDNNTVLGYNQILVDPNKTSPDANTVYAARFVTTSNYPGIEFVPLSGEIGNQRADIIKNKSGLSPVEANPDLLYGETYKWYLARIPNPDKTVGGYKYLRFDTINVGATTNREKVGFVFGGYVKTKTYTDYTDTLANATPIRLYQPLVGDKIYTNFLIQFYMPKYTYSYDPVAKAWSAQVNTFPNVSDQYSTVSIPGGGAVCFAKLSDVQTNYIVATRAYGGPKGTDPDGTRFSRVLTQNTTPSCGCTGSFITPQWMGENRLLNLPLNNQLWRGTPNTDPTAVAMNSWIATGDAVSGTQAPVGTAKAAILTIDQTKVKATTLKHTYVTTINKEKNGTVNIPFTLGGNLTDPANMTSIPGFASDVKVPLYYVQNADGWYLTVVPLTDMKDSQVTLDDVNGVKLQWRQNLYKYNDDKNVDKRVFQLFAISGCERDQFNGTYGNWIYLPLAAYTANYSSGSITDMTPVYNSNLGTGMPKDPTCLANDTINNDITACFRISQYSAADNDTKNLVVFRSNSMAGTGNLTPVEFRVSKFKYLPWDGCNNVLVQNAGVSAIKGQYYSFNQMKDIDPDFINYALDAHWTVTIDSKTDPDMPLINFSPELQKMYGNPVTPTQLKDSYLILNVAKSQKTTDGDTIYVMKFNKTDYENGAPAVYDTLSLKCAQHEMPFFDLEANGNFDLSKKLAIVETPFVNRNLAYIVDNDATTPFAVKDGKGNVLYYRCFIDNMVECDFTDAQYLNVYPENRKELTPSVNGKDTHVIPYYSFSISTSDGNEYFLNVNTTDPSRDGYSINWDAITPAQKTMLMNPKDDKDNNQMTNFKFCLPYKFEYDAVTKTWSKSTVTCKEVEYPAVYLQTMEDGVDKDGNNIYPNLIVASSATKYVTAQPLDKAIQSGSNCLVNNIYSVDYRFIDPTKVTSWVFGGAEANSNVWVPLNGVFDNEPPYVLPNTGQFTNTDVSSGNTFISQGVDNALNTQLNQPNLKIGMLTGLTAADNPLTVTFAGDTTIGEWAVRPIWYYRISSSDGEYLTDATNTKTDYIYNFQTGKYPLAYFTTLLPLRGDEATTHIYADKAFSQVFGFRYVTDDTDSTFYIVSNADFTKSKTAGLEDSYRYLAQVNNHLVFVDTKADALAFQWGNINDGKFTEIQVVGKGGIFGVPGGVKFLNTTGKVDIYSIDGRLIKSAVLTGSEQTLDAPRGIAIVKAGSKVVKVVVQ